MVAMVLARAAAGDLTALDEYATWVRVAHPQAIWYKYTEADFEPLCRYPNHPAIVKTTEWLFNDKASPWYPILVRDEWQKELSLNALSSPLVAIPAFRKRVLQLLEDRQQVGHVKVTSNEKIALGVDWTERHQRFPTTPFARRRARKALSASAMPAPMDCRGWRARRSVNCSGRKRNAIGRWRPVPLLAAVRPPLTPG